MITSGPRVQCQVLHFGSMKLVWINSYLPCDPQHDFDDTELLGCLAEVERIVSSHSDCEVVWSGDLNWSMDRDNQFTRTMSSTVDRVNLVPLWKQHEVDFTHIHTDNMSTSTIDHFILSPGLLALVEGCGPVHWGDNLSRRR